MNEQPSQLVAGALAGDAAAQKALYDAHARRVVAYFLRCGFSRADADDLAQETFARVFRSLGGFDPARGALGAWIAAIARNVARKRWRRRPQPGSFDPEIAADVLGADDDPPADAAAREEIHALRACVAALPDELARAVRLRYVEGRTTRGIADAMGMPEATVRLRLGEAREALARCLRTKGVLG